MRRLLALLVLIAAPAFALTPEEAAYIAERDKAITALEQKWSNDAHDRAIASLTLKLKRIVGPPPKGVAGEGRMTPDSLCCGVGSDKLDAMVFGDVSVTTDGLLRQWLGDKTKPPLAIEAGIEEGAEIYSTGISGDAAVTVYARLPIVPPPDVTQAVAHLTLASQGGALWPPKDLGVIVRKGGRVFIAFTPVTSVPALPACEAVLAKKDDDEVGYVDCWTTRVREAVAYPAILRQAQEIADTFAAQ